jgi:hypothetical protein
LKLKLSSKLRLSSSFGTQIASGLPWFARLVLGAKETSAFAMFAKGKLRFLTITTAATNEIL